MRNKPLQRPGRLPGPGEAHLDVRGVLYGLLVLLQDLLQLSVLLHDALVLEANSVLLVLLPVRGCSLQLL